MKKILLIPFIVCTLQCKAQYKEPSISESDKALLEFLYKNSNKAKVTPSHYFDELSEWDLSNNTLKQKMKILFKNDKNLNQKLKELEEAIENIPAHILAHFDYGFRKFDVTVEELKDFEPQRPARPLSQNDRVQLDF